MVIGTWRERFGISKGGQRFILRTGCVLPVIAPHGNITAAQRSVEKLGK